MRALVLALVAVVATGCGVGSKPAAGPYVWACTPANYDSGSNTNASVFVYNGSATTANVAVKILNKSGTNLAGVQVPGAAPGTLYPGQTGTNTVPVSADNTLIVSWLTAQGLPASGGNIAATVRIVSDQPIVVGSNIEFSGFHPGACGYLHP
jgi:hypothetical protein